MIVVRAQVTRRGSTFSFWASELLVHTYESEDPCVIIITRAAHSNTLIVRGTGSEFHTYESEDPCTHQVYNVYHS
jgi:hypothetical protein